MSSGKFNRHLAIFGLGTVLAMLALAPSASAQDGTAWKVDCGGDGKTLDCRAFQQMVNREDKQVVAQLSVRWAADGKSSTLTLQLPLGISLTEPVQLKIDNGAVERFPVQTCTNAGCIVSVPLKDPFLGQLRGGTTLKISLQTPDKRTLVIDVPLLGFGLAVDKAK